MTRSKYRNVPTVVDGIRFSSKKEANRDAELRLLERAGKIGSLERQPRFPLIVNGVKVCTYVGDWRYWEMSEGGHPAQRPSGPRPGRHPIGCQIVEDWKSGVQTPEFKIKWKLANALYPEVEWRLTGTSKDPAK